MNYAAALAYAATLAVLTLCGFRRPLFLCALACWCGAEAFGWSDGGWQAMGAIAGLLAAVEFAWCELGRTR